MTGHVAAAVAEATRASALDPHAFVSGLARVSVFAMSDVAHGAIAAASQTMAKFGRHPFFLQLLPLAYLKRGDARRAEAVYSELQARSEIDDVPRSALALAASALGRTDEAIDFALESAERCDATTPFWTRAPPFASDAVRAHPRYPELRRAMGHDRASHCRPRGPLSPRQRTRRRRHGHGALDRPQGAQQRARTDRHDSQSRDQG